MVDGETVAEGADEDLIAAQIVGYDRGIGIGAGLALETSKPLGTVGAGGSLGSLKRLAVLLDEEEAHGADEFLVARQVGSDRSGISVGTGRALRPRLSRDALEPTEIFGVVDGETVAEGADENLIAAQIVGHDRGIGVGAGRARSALETSEALSTIVADRALGALAPGIADDALDAAKTLRALEALRPDGSPGAHRTLGPAERVGVVGGEAQAEIAHEPVAGAKRIGDRVGLGVRAGRSDGTGLAGRARRAAEHVAETLDEGARDVAEESAVIGKHARDLCGVGISPGQSGRALGADRALWPFGTGLAPGPFQVLAEVADEDRGEVFEETLVSAQRAGDLIGIGVAAGLALRAPGADGTARAFETSGPAESLGVHLGELGRHFDRIGAGTGLTSETRQALGANRPFGAQLAAQSLRSGIALGADEPPQRVGVCFDELIAELADKSVVGGEFIGDRGGIGVGAGDAGGAGLAGGADFALRTDGAQLANGSWRAEFTSRAGLALQAGLALCAGLASRAHGPDEGLGVRLDEALTEPPDEYVVGGEALGHDQRIGIGTGRTEITRRTGLALRAGGADRTEERFGMIVDEARAEITDELVVGAKGGRDVERIGVGAVRAALTPRSGLSGHALGALLAANTGISPKALFADDALRALFTGCALFTGHAGRARLTLRTREALRSANRLWMRVDELTPDRGEKIRILVQHHRHEAGVGGLAGLAARTDRTRGAAEHVGVLGGHQLADGAEEYRVFDQHVGDEERTDVGARLTPGTGLARRAGRTVEARFALRTDIAAGTARPP